MQPTLTPTLTPSPAPAQAPATLPANFNFGTTSTPPAAPATLPANFDFSAGQPGVGSKIIAAAEEPIKDIAEQAESGAEQFGGGISQIWQQTGASGNKPISYSQLGRGILNATAGGLNLAFSPVTGTIQALSKAPGIKQAVQAVKNYIITPAANKISDIPALQQFMLKYPNADEVAANLMTIGLSLAGGEKAPEAMEAAQNAATPVIEGMKNAVDKVTPSAQTFGFDKAAQIDNLENDYERWTGATKSGVKALNKTEIKTAALDNSGTVGRAPQRVLAEAGIIPETTGTKFTTFDQANNFRQGIQPLVDARDEALDTIKYMTPETQIDDLRANTIQRIQNLSLPQGDIESRINSANNEYDLLQKKYGNSMDVSEMGNEKTIYNKPVKFDSTKPFQSDVNYQIGKTFQTTIEKSARDAGFADVAQLNREIGDRLEAANMLQRLDGQTLKFGKMGRYAFQIIGSSLGKSIPGKIVGALGGEYVADFLMRADVANPVKRLVLSSIEKDNPAAYSSILKWINEQDALRSTTKLLPEGAPAGTEGNPIITPEPKQKPSLNEGSFSAEAKRVSIKSPKTGKFERAYTSEVRNPKP